MKTKYFSQGNEFVIKDYNSSKPFAGFLPGIAGLRGKPLWAFYVNRAQCMVSFGIRNKDGAIMEFYPANTARRRVSLEGFRTFIKVRGEKRIYEPFSPSKERGSDQTLFIAPHEIRIEEISKNPTLKTEVVYFTIPGETFPGLARILRLENRSRRKLDLEVIDGMPKICPFGMNEWFMKEMSRTIEAWMEVDGWLEKHPFYRLRVSAEDVSEVRYIREGNFYLSVTGAGKRPRVAVDPAAVFGKLDDFTFPERLAEENFKLTNKQRYKNITPSAMSHDKFTVPAGKSVYLYSLIGHAANSGELAKISRKISAGFFKRKRVENGLVTEEVSSSLFTRSGSENFDAYVAQTNLDNALRGGFPVTGRKGKIIYVYNRKHGDLERDYNNFVLEPEFYSQGNGNFRDVCQNRRNSVWVNPAVGTKDIKDFYNLIQLDGFNPLIVKGDSKGHPLFVEAEHGEGYWIDHWTYTLDLVKSYLALFPEKKSALIFKDRGYMFFDSPYRVKPRSRRYVTEGRKVRQYDSVFLDREKESLINARTEPRKWVRTKKGKGALYKCTLAAKMISLIANKIASLDAAGCGMEMEADRPGWCDSLNGLPGIMGSSFPEVCELLRLARFLKRAIEEEKRVHIELPIEVLSFVMGLDKALKETRDGGIKSRRAYWEKSNSLKEKYREKVRFDLSGRQEKITNKELAAFLSLVEAKLAAALKINKGKNGIPHTYFKKTSKSGSLPLPLFLEGPARLLKITKDKHRARSLYGNLRRSDLFDQALGMYKLNASLKKETLEIGRARVFTPGWLENESIWLHMEYKYLLEILRSGLYEEFYRDFKKVLIPFQDPAMYGRSIFENSSFLVGSRFFDKGLHGTGFVARLTGATAEFLHMLRIMNLGERPFRITDRGVIFEPAPVLHKELFAKDSYAFGLLKNTLIVYKNPKRRNTFGAGGVKPVKFTATTRSGKTSVFNTPYLEKPYSDYLRRGKLRKVSILLG